MFTENGNWGDYVCANTLNIHVCEKPAPSPKPIVKGGAGNIYMFKAFNVKFSEIFLYLFLLLY